MEDTQEIEDTSDLIDHLENLTKAPTLNISGRPFNKDKIHCYGCKESSHMQDCPELNRCHKDDKADPKKFEDYTYIYSGPDIQPQMQITRVNPTMSTTYDQASGVIKDSINTANPLASLNL